MRTPNPFSFQLQTPLDSFIRMHCIHSRRLGSHPFPHLAAPVYLFEVRFGTNQHIIHPSSHPAAIASHRPHLLYLAQSTQTLPISIHPYSIFFGFAPSRLLLASHFSISSSHPPRSSPSRFQTRPIFVCFGFDLVFGIRHETTLIPYQPSNFKALPVLLSSPRRRLAPTKVESSNAFFLGTRLDR